MVPCSLLAQLTSDYDGDVRLDDGSHEADCKSIAELLLLGGKSGDVLTLTVRGEEAEAMMERIATFFKSGFETEF